MNQDFQRRWYAYAFWVALVPLSIVAGGLSILSEKLALMAFVPLGIAMFIFGWWTLFGYYYDAKVSDETGYRPYWWAWAIGHIILSPVLVAPVYLVRRTWKAGLPPRVKGLIGR